MWVLSNGAAEEGVIHKTNVYCINLEHHLLFNVSMFCCCVRVRVLGMDVDAILALAGANLSYPSEDTAELRDSLTSLLPPTKEYNIKSIKGSNESFLAHFDIDVTTKDDLYLFLEQYKEVTKEQLRIAKNA